MGHREHEASKEGCTTPLSTNKVLHRLWCPTPMLDSKRTFSFILFIMAVSPISTS